LRIRWLQPSYGAHSYSHILAPTSTKQVSLTHIHTPSLYIATQLSLHTHTHTCWCCNTATATVTHTHYTHTLTHTRTHALTHTCLPPHYHTATCVLYITHAAPTSRNLTCSQTHLHTQLGLAGRAAQAAGPEPPGSSTADGKHSFPTVASQWKCPLRWNNDRESAPRSVAEGTYKELQCLKRVESKRLFLIAH